MMRKLLAAVMTGFIALFILAIPAAAGRQWCAKDPIVALNGHEVQILVAVPEEMQPAVTGPIHVFVVTHADVMQELIFTDSGFNGFGETVEFATRPGRGDIDEDDSFNARIRVSIQVDTSLLSMLDNVGNGDTVPIQVTIIMDGETTVFYGQSRGLTRVITVGES